MAVNAASNFLQDKVLGDRETDNTTQYKADESGEKMTALTWQGKHSVKISHDVPKPAVTDAHDAVIRVTGSTICGSDLHLYGGDILQLKAGDIIGHEGMGIVESVGPDCKKVKKGDRVVASFSISCGQCNRCKEDLGSMCETTNSSSVQEKLYGRPFAGLLGYAHFTGGYAGCQSEFFRVPYADNNLLVIDGAAKDLPDEKVMFLSDIVCTSYHSVVDIGFDKDGEGKSVAIWGAGPIGLNVAQFLKIFKAGRIVMIDSESNRLQFAKDKLGVDTINFSETPNVVEELYKREAEGFDYAFDCAGFRYAKSVAHKLMRAAALETDTPENLNEAIVSVRKFGKISIPADYAGLANGFNIGALMEKGIMLKGNGQAPAQRYMKHLLDNYIVTGKFDPTLILTHRFKLEDLDKLYAAFNAKADASGVPILKTFVETRFSNPPGPGMPTVSQVPDVKTGIFG